MFLQLCSLHDQEETALMINDMALPRHMWSHDNISHCRSCQKIFRRVLGCVTVEIQILSFLLPAVTLSVSTSFLTLWFSDCRSFMRCSAWLSWASSSASSSLLPSWNSSSSSWASWKLQAHRKKKSNQTSWDTMRSGLKAGWEKFIISHTSLFVNIWLDHWPPSADTGVMWCIFNVIYIIVFCTRGSIINPNLSGFRDGNFSYRPWLKGFSLMWNMCTVRMC